MATWMLCFITAAAFIAAYEAARKAGETLRVSNAAYELETEPLLGVWLCSSSEHKVPRVELYVVGDQLESTPRSRLREDAYVPVHFDLENLGRSALRNVLVPLQLNDRPPVDVRIGNIGPDKYAHVILFFEWDILKRPTIAWLSPAIERGQPLDYTPLPRLRVARNVASDARRRATRPLDARQRKWRLSFVEAAAVAKSEEDEPKVSS